MSAMEPSGWTSVISTRRGSAPSSRKSRKRTPSAPVRSPSIPVSRSQWAAVNATRSGTGASAGTTTKSLLVPWYFSTVTVCSLVLMAPPVR
jgi:hypothetical protein